MTRLNKLSALAAVVALSGGLAACGGGSSKTTGMDEMEMEPELTDQQVCEMAGGRWNDDMSCTDSAGLAAEVKAATAAAATKETAIGEEAEQETEAGLGGSAVTATGNAEGAYNATVAADGMVTVTVEGADDDADEDFVQAMDLGHGSTMHTRTMDADSDGNVVQEIAIVTTNRDAPVPVAFAKFEVTAMDGMTTTPQALDTSTNTENDTPTATNEALAVAQNAATYALVKSSGFSATGTGELSFDGDDPADDEDAAYMTDGTYNGAMGTYMCNGGATGCTVTLGADGITAMSAGWVFTPDEGATSDQPDYDYLTYGVWLQKTTDADGADTYNEVQTFAMSSMNASDGGTLDDVNGSASYSGGATGVYVRHVYSAGGGELESSTSGHFRAMANLTAHFGGGSIPADDHNTVTGMIRNFMLSGGEANDWSVALKGTRADGANMITGTANGGGAEAMFSGTYYGAVTADTDGTDENESVYPSSVAGEFNANFSNGTVAGAFGATQDE